MIEPGRGPLFAFAVVVVAAAPLLAQGQSPRGLRPADAAAPRRVITLDEAWKIADAQSFDLRIAAARVDESEAVVRRAWGALLPSVSLGGGYTFSFPEQKFAFGDPDQAQQQALLFASIADITEQSAALNPDPLAQRAALERAEELRRAAKDIASAPVTEIAIQPAHSFDGQLSVQVPVLVPRAWPLLQNAYAGADIARVSTQHARGQIRFAVARTYLQVVATQKVVGIAARSVESATRHRDLAKQRVEQGLITELALQRAELEVARAEQQQRAALGGLRLAKAALGGIIGVLDDFDVADAPPASVAEEGLAVDALLKRAVAGRDDLKAQQEVLAIAERSRTEAWLRFLPNVVLTGTGRGTSNTEGLVSQPFSGSVAVQAQLPLFEGGQTLAAIDEADARVRQEALKRAQLEQTVEQEVRGALDDIALKRDSLATAQRVAELAEKNKANADHFFELGAATSLDVADASLGAWSAQVDAARAALDLETARLGLLVAIGALGPG